ncbi:hypothetical protein AB0F92_14525 [Kitasatospora aureofaciens]|uniref:ATP-grasp domain-containing protein n=1 Tax=Kitasatospora aureofaciens TaxID=1894 RepID=UPI0033E5DDF9
MPKSLLLIGADRHVLRACGDLGIDVTVVYGTSAKEFGLPPFPDEARHVYVEDQQNIDSILTGLYREGLGAYPFDAVYTSDEGAVIASAAVGRHFGTRAISMKTAVNFRDKSVQKQIVRNAGIRTARFEVIPDVTSLADDWVFPFESAVVKPIAGAATALTYKVGSRADIEQVAERVRNSRTPQRTFLLEDFNQGQEWQVDGVVHDGELLFLSVGRYGDPFLTVVTEQKPPSMRKYDPVSESWAYDLATPLVRGALKALELDSGIFHMELFHDATQNLLAFGECAARRGGGLTEEEVFHKFGVSLSRCAVQSTLGQVPEISPSVRSATVGSIVLPIVEGTLLSCPSAEEISTLPGAVFAKIDLPVGYVMPEVAQNTVVKLGMVILEADSPADLWKRLDEVLAWFHERLVVIPARVTPSQLRTWEQGICVTRRSGA